MSARELVVLGTASQALPGPARRAGEEHGDVVVAHDLAVLPVAARA